MRRAPCPPRWSGTLTPEGFRRLLGHSREAIEAPQTLCPVGCRLVWRIEVAEVTTSVLRLVCHCQYFSSVASHALRVSSLADVYARTVLQFGRQPLLPHNHPPSSVVRPKVQAQIPML
jgi:hypothetical protein